MNPNSEPMISLSTVLLLFLVPVVVVGVVLLIRRMRQRWLAADEAARGRWSSMSCGVLMVTGVLSMIVGGIAIMMMIQEFEQAFTH